MVRLLAITAVGALAFAVYALSARSVLHGRVTETSLAVSVGSASRSGGEPLAAGGCRRQGRGGVWSCDLPDREDSGAVRYTVRVRPGTSCWVATLVVSSSEGGMPQHARGCVRRWQWSIV